MTTHLITGATGFVGGAIALELLDGSDDRIVAVVRAADPEAARARLHDELADMADGYGRPDLVPAIRERTVAVVGDITSPGCGVHAAEIPAVDQFWHVAASLKYEEKDRDEIERLNIGGTRNALALAGAVATPVFNYVSTAYVSGSRHGEVLEDDPSDATWSNNCYEASKIHAEDLVRAASGEFRHRIMRPSIVVGHSTTAHGLNWSGMYGFVRALLVFRKRAERTVGTLLEHTRLRLLADPEVPLHLVPVDVVARNAVAIARSGSSGTCFHLGAGDALDVRTVVSTIFEMVGLRTPLWVGDRDGFTALDEALDKGMNFYRSYLWAAKRFDAANTASVCGPRAVQAGIDREQLTAHIEYYLATQSTSARALAPRRVLHPVVR